MRIGVKRVSSDVTFSPAFQRTRTQTFTLLSLFRAHRANVSAIEHAIKADHGYTLESRAVQNLVEVMAGYDKEERRQFLQL